MPKTPLDLSTPPKRPLVAASILSADFGDMATECRDVLDRGADLLHVDIMDGHFVPNLTMGPDMVRALRHHFPNVFLDVHLMVERPDEFADAFIDAGASLLSFHIEVSKPHGPVDAAALIKHLHSRGVKAGMVVNPPTPVEHLEPHLAELDLALVMSVNPGRSGQKFIDDVLSKTQWLRQRLGQHTRLEMDGGLNGHDTGPRAVAAGADVLVTASALFGADDRTQVIEQMHGCELVH